MEQTAEVISMIHFVVAGNYEQFKQFLNTHKDGNNYKYVYSLESLLGIDDAEFHYIGTYETRSDIDDIMEMIFKIQTRRKHMPFHIPLP